MTLTILGLGPGDPDDLSRRAWHTLETAPAVYLRTKHHPCVPHLPNRDAYHSFDHLYESIDDFPTVYATIAEQVIAAAKQGDVVYAVPGDPMVAEAAVKHLLERAPHEGIDVKVVSGISFVEPSLALLGVDALDGLQLVDAITVSGMHHPPINPDYPALLGQIYSRDVASALKLTLMNQYPDDFQVTLIHAAGTDAARAETVPLYAIDRADDLAYLSALYLPALGGMSSFEQFQEVIAHLRAPEGCPWDREQTHLSLRKYLVEEAYEVLEALDAEDSDALRDELGDLLLQIVLHAQIATEDGEFYMTDVIRRVNEKMIRRHPHVWGETVVDSAGQVVTNWEAIKQQERAANGDTPRDSILDGVSVSLPALLKSYEYQKRAAKVGFEWNTVEGVRDKVLEELDEVMEAEDPDHRFEEVGDLLFVLVNWARWLGVEPEAALRASNHKFERRFGHVERRVRESGQDWKTYTLDQLDAFWDEAKALGL